MPEDDGAVADVGVDLGQEVAADDHRLAFGVVDVVGEDGAAARDLVAHEFRGDEFLDAGAEGFAGVLLQQQRIAHRVQALVLADGDVFHLRSDDALARVMHLADVGAGAWPRRGSVRLGKRTASRRALLSRPRPNSELSCDSSSVSPRSSIHFARSAGRPTDRSMRRIGIGVGTGGIVDGDRWILFAAEQGRRLRSARFRASRTWISGREPCTKILREPGMGRVTVSDNCWVSCSRREGSALRAGDFGIAFIGIVQGGGGTKRRRRI